MQSNNPMRLDPIPLSWRDRCESTRQKLLAGSTFAYTKLQNVVISIPSFLRDLFPLTQWITDYNLKWLWDDFLSGITMCLVLVPQSIAYAKMAGLPAQYGLYSSALAPILYGLFGTCREASIGPTAILAGTLAKFIGKIVYEKPHLPPDQVANALAFLLGVTTLVLGLIRMGDLVDFIPMSVTLGFINGTALSIVASQLPKLMGVPIDSSLDPTPTLIYNIFKNLYQLNYIDLLFGLGSLLLYLVLLKLNNRFNLKIRFLLTLIVICVCLLVTFCIFKAHPDFNLSILKSMTIDFQFHFPRIQPDIWEEVKGLIISVFLVCTMEHISVTRKMATRSMYLVDNSQEWFSLGLANIASSCFGGFPVSGSLTRSIIQSDCRSKTPFCNVITGCLVFVVMYALTPVFYYLPMPTVAGVILIASYNLLDPLGAWQRLFKINWIDGFIAFITASLTFLWGIEIGVFTGLGLALANLLFALSHPKLLILPPTDSRQRTQPANVSTPDLSGLPQWMYVQPQDSFLFTNSSRVCLSILDQVLYYCAPETVPETIEDRIWSPRDVFKRSAKLKAHQLPFTPTQQGVRDRDFPLKGIIFNFCNVNKLDFTSVQSLIELQILVKNFIQFNSPKPIPFYFIHVKTNVLDALIAAEIVSWDKVVWEGGVGEGNWGQVIRIDSNVPRNNFETIHRQNSVHFNWQNLINYLVV